MARYDDERLSTRRPRILLIWLSLLCIGLYVLDRQGMLGSITTYTAPLLTPVTKSLTSIRHTAGDWLHDLFKSSDLEQENAQLKDELTRLQNENLALRSAEVENTRLRRTAGMRERYGWRTVIANVVARSPDNAVRQIVLDRGSKDGLQLGMPVVSHVAGSPDALIGLIDQLSEDTATVLLITDVRSVVSGYILHRDAQGNVPAQPNGEIEGQWQLGSRLMMRQIEREVNFAIGDDVLTAGISREINFDAPAARIPPNIPIGKVITRQPDGHGQSAEIQPYFDPEQVQTVWIIVAVD